MSPFDPFSFFEKFIPARRLHQIIRIAIIVLLIIFLFIRIQEYGHYLVKPLWAVETFIFAILIIVYAIRVNPVDRSVGVKEIVMPLIGGILPFALLISSPHAWIYQNSILLIGVFWWMTLASALTVWGMWTLRRSFSITVEARVLVTHGPYRWIRHPIYIGEVFTAGAVAVWRLSVLNIIIFLLFLGIQLYRAKLEEAKLRRVFRNYSAFSKKSRWI